MAAAKKPRVSGGPAQPEDLFTGAVVFYRGDQRGVVRDAFAPLDQFWIADEQSGDLIRSEDGEIVPFSASELVIAPPSGRPPAGGGKSMGFARVLVIGTEPQMLQILEQFGAPDASERKDPQQLLAVPCSWTKCGPSGEKDECPLTQLAREGIDEAMMTLARRLRPDISVDVRAVHLKQALEQLGPDLTRLDDYYCLSAVTLPFGQHEIQAASGWERYWMEDIRCQIDLGVSSESAREESEGSLDDVAKRGLAEACGVRLSDRIWGEDVQSQLRRKLGVDMPLKLFDGPETKVYVLVIPEDAVATSDQGVLTFRERALAGASRGAGGEKTIAEWKLEQAQFKDMPKLPEGWIYIRSRKSNEVYYWDTRNNKPSYERPLPEGWTKQKSKSTGKTYYFNAKKRKSLFEFPSE